MERIMGAFDLFGGIALNSTKSVLKWLIIASMVLGTIFTILTLLVIHLVF